MCGMSLSASLALVVRVGPGTDSRDFAFLGKGSWHLLSPKVFESVFDIAYEQRLSLNPNYDQVLDLQAESIQASQDPSG